jgi:hypothetical protein
MHSHFNYRLGTRGFGNNFNPDPKKCTGTCPLEIKTKPLKFITGIAENLEKSRLTQKTIIMKKNLLLLALLVTSSVIFAQNKQIN